MKKTYVDRYIAFLFLFCSAVALNSCFKDLTKKNIVYSNDFEEGNIKGIKLENFFGAISYNKIVPYNGSNTFGRFNNTRFTLKLDTLPTHNTLSVEFYLNIHDKWEGNNISAVGIPDIWQMKFDDGVVLLTTFSNTVHQQAYPYFYTPGSGMPARANAFDITLPGVCGSQGVIGGTTSYKIAKIFAHSAPTFKLECSDALQPFNDSCFKSWSIDNLTITASKY